LRTDIYVKLINSKFWKWSDIIAGNIKNDWNAKTTKDNSTNTAHDKEFNYSLSKLHSLHLLGPQVDPYLKLHTAHKKWLDSLCV